MPLSQLASALSQNDSVSAIAVFDPKMAGYATVESNIEALVAQTDILCAIDIVEQKDVRIEMKIPKRNSRSIGICS